MVQNAEILVQKADGHEVLCQQEITQRPEVSVNETVLVYLLLG